jgi:Parvulin-like peptidyl-prolyl isomerase
VKFKKFSLLAATGLTVLSLAACGKKATTDSDIVTMKGDTIRVTDFYEAARTSISTPSSQVMQQLVIDKVLNEKYKGKVTDKDVDKELSTVKNQLGSSYSAVLQQQGITEENYKATIKTNLLIKYAVDQSIKKNEYTDANLKAAWKTYHPEVTAQIIVLSDEETAKSVLKEVKASDADFGKIAKEKSEDTATKSKGGEVKFDSTSTTIPTTVQEAAYKLENGKISDVITNMDQNTGATTYYIVKMDKNSSKGNDMNKYKSELEKSIKTEKEGDSSYVNGVLGKILKEYNVTIKDKDFDGILSQYTDSSVTKTSSK